MKLCFCGSSHLFEDCCGPYLKRESQPHTAEALMRSRYSAYCCSNVDYIINTTHISTRKLHDRSSTLAFAKNNHWLKLEIIKVSTDTVEFKAYYLDQSLVPNVHYEKSTFKQEDGIWYYLDGQWD